MDVLGRFPRVRCPTCSKMQPMMFEVMKAIDKDDHDAANIVCGVCKSIIATLHGPSADSDEVAWAFRDDVARCSDIMSPRARCLAG
jgi:ribosomal protein S27E